MFAYTDVNEYYVRISFTNSNGGRPIAKNYYVASDSEKNATHTAIELFYQYIRDYYGYLPCGRVVPEFCHKNK